MFLFLNLSQGIEHVVQDVYEDSVPMSPSLLAIALAEFQQKITIPFFSKTEITIWSDYVGSYELKFVRESTVRAFEFYSQYFEVPYALEKLDILIIENYQQWDEEKYGLIVMK